MSELYYGYCFPEPDGWHTPRVVLRSAEAALTYCKLQHKLFREIRITDPDDFIVMHVIDHICKVPQEDGSLKEYDLRGLVL